MIKIEDGHAPLYALSQEELAQLTLGVALDRLAQPVAIDRAPRDGARVRFRSVSDAERVLAYIA